MRANLYQIFYDERSRQMLDSGFKPLDNLENPRPDWAEFWVIRRFLTGSELREDELYGFFSPKFGMKTSLDSRAVFAFLDQHSSEETDVYTFSPYWDAAAFFLNVYEQGEFWHPGLLDVSHQFLGAIGKPLQLASFPMHSANTVYCNFFAARPRFWRRWLEIGECLFDIAEGELDGLGKRLMSSAPHDGPRPYELKVFMQERIVSLLLATEPWKVTNYNMFRLNNLLTNFHPFRRELIACDALKASYAHTGHSDYLEEYKKIRSSIATACNAGLPLLS